GASSFIRFRFLLPFLYRLVQLRPVLMKLLFAMSVCSGWVGEAEQICMCVYLHFSDDIFSRFPERNDESGCRDHAEFFWEKMMRISFEHGGFVDRRRVAGVVFSFKENGIFNDGGRMEIGAMCRKQCCSRIDMQGVCESYFIE